MLGLAIGSSDRANVQSPFMAPDLPVVHIMAASTGRELHAIEGLSSPATADLDGDGLADLWGELGGNVCAFRGLAAESWRALGGFQPAGDLDGDGLADVVNNDLGREENATDERTDSRTVITRSGRDGRLLWQAPLEQWEDWSNWNNVTGSYTIVPLKLPNGDLDGDGIPDLIAQRSMWGSPHSYELRGGPGIAGSFGTHRTPALVLRSAPLYRRDPLRQRRYQGHDSLPRRSSRRYGSVRAASSLHAGKRATAFCNGTRITNRTGFGSRRPRCVGRAPRGLPWAIWQARPFRSAECRPGR